MQIEPCMKARYCINGRFLTRPTTGVDRYAREIILCLDGLLAPEEAVLAVPSNAGLVEPLKLNNIKLVQIGKHNGHAWEQIDYSRYLKENHLLGVNLCNTAPLRNPGVACIHDMAIRANPHFFSTKFATWYRVLFSSVTKRADAIITVSKFSKQEIERYYPKSKGKIHVVGNAWQHVSRAVPDNTALFRHDLKPQAYYFAMSSLAPNKNLRWLVETACLNPNETFVIAGGINTKVFGEQDIPQADNVVYTGYVTDGEAVALMENCKAFLYPTFYEGFGIPPMEAMACGAPAIVSDTAVMHEIYDDSVSYIDPYSAVGNILDLTEEASNKHSVSHKKLLDEYNWSVSAKKLASILEKTITQ